jgi:putative copper export protein
LRVNGFIGAHPETARDMLTAYLHVRDSAAAVAEHCRKAGLAEPSCRYAVAVGFVSAVAIPASLILAFLGINASQVSSTRSMFSHQYLGMYLTVAAVIVLGAVLSLALYVQQRRDARQHRTSDQRSRWTLTTDEPQI